MDILELIKKDHKTVLGILDKLESSTERAQKTRQNQLEHLKQELLPHMFAEENYLYEFLLDKVSDKKKREKILEGLEEHKAAKSVLSDIEAVTVSDEHWHPDIKVLKELISHHIKEEESEIFEIAGNVIEDQKEAADKFQSLKKEAKVEI